MTRYLLAFLLGIITLLVILLLLHGSEQTEVYHELQESQEELNHEKARHESLRHRYDSLRQLLGERPRF